MIESLNPDMDQLMGILKVNLIDQRFKINCYGTPEVHILISNC